MKSTKRVGFLCCACHVSHVLPWPIVEDALQLQRAVPYHFETFLKSRRCSYFHVVSTQGHLFYSFLMIRMMFVALSWCRAPEDPRHLVCLGADPAGGAGPEAPGHDRRGAGRSVPPTASATAPPVDSPYIR